MIINRIFKNALPIDEFIEEYYRIIIMKNEEFAEYSKENQVEIGNFDNEIDYLNKIKEELNDKLDVLTEALKIKLKNIIKRIEIRQERFRDINDKISSTGVLYDYNSFFKFLDSLVTFHNQSLLYKEEKELDEEIIKNKVKFKSLAETNFSTVVEKIQTSYFNKEYSTFAELDSKINNLKKIQDKYNITTLLEFTQLKKHIENDREIIKSFFESHLLWQEREIPELMELYQKKLPIEIRLKNTRIKYDKLLERKQEIKDYIEEQLIHQATAITLNIDTLAYYDQAIVEIKKYNQTLMSEKVNLAIKEAEVASETKKEIISYLKFIREHEEFPVERKIEIINNTKNFRNLEKFPKLAKSIELIKNQIREELHISFKALMEEKRFDVLKSFSGKNQNLEIDSDLLKFKMLSPESEEKLNYLIKLKDTINPIKAKMRVISLQPHGLPKLRAIEKFQGEMLKNENIEKDIKDKILLYFQELYQDLIKLTKIGAENYNLDIFDTFENRRYKVFIRRDKIIKIGRRGEPLNDLILHCKYIDKEHFAIDLKKRNIINYFSKDKAAAKVYNFTIFNNESLNGVKELSKVVDKLNIADLLEANIRTVSDDIITLNFTKIYGKEHCENCFEMHHNCKGCDDEYLEKLKNTTYIFVRNKKAKIYFSDSNGLIVSQENYDATGLTVELDNGVISSKYPFFGTEKNMITETEYLFHDRFNFKVQTITSKVF